MILVAVGANLPGPAGRTPLQTCRWAVERLAAIPGLDVVAVSRWYRSAPVPPPVPPAVQPDYVNGAVRLAGRAAPHALLARLQAIEAEAGRTRTVPNAARTLDLDLLAIDDLVLSTGALTLPHPRLRSRAFVLAPLVDVAPDWNHPDGGVPAAMLAVSDRSGLSLLGST